MAAEDRCVIAHRQGIGVVKHHLPVWPLACDAPHMHDDDLIARIRRSVEGEMEIAKIGAKPLAKKAKIGETVVRDLIKGHTKDVQVGTLEKIARALMIPVSRLLPLDFDVEHSGAKFRVELPTEDELMSALLEVIPDMPRGSLDKRARFLAESVARILRLPPSRQANDAAPLDRPPADPGEGAPPPEATS